MEKRRALIICTGNCCRSQMAEGLLRELAGAQWEVCSAGSLPAGFIHQYAIAAMAEVGIDISSHESKSIGVYLDQTFDYVITVCDDAKDACPTFPSAGKTFHWPLEDPASKWDDEAAGMEVARRVRDDLKGKFTQLLAEDATPQSGA